MQTRPLTILKLALHVPGYRRLFENLRITQCFGIQINYIRWNIYYFYGARIINFRTNDYLQIEESLIKYLRPGYKDDMQ